MPNKEHIKWLDEPEEHDYPAAQDYLELLFDSGPVKWIVRNLREAPVMSKKAKDIIRASELPVLTQSNSHVRKDLEKIAAGKHLSPVLLVRGNPGGKLLIADGYHRVCSVYSIDEDAEIPCKLV